MLPFPCSLWSCLCERNLSRSLLCMSWGMDRGWLQHTRYGEWCSIPGVLVWGGVRTAADWLKPCVCHTSDGEVQHIKHWIKCICCSAYTQTGTQCLLFPIACDPACVRGTCTEDRVCVCPEGWTGEVCNIPGMNIKCPYNSHIQFHGPSACKGVKSGPHITLCTLLCSLWSCLCEGYMYRRHGLCMSWEMDRGWLQHTRYGEWCNTPCKVHVYL